jgi:hypothetical protein
MTISKQDHDDSILMADIIDGLDHAEPDHLPRCDCGWLFEICDYPNCPCGADPR